jgi:hypothetical protein
MRKIMQRQGDVLLTTHVYNASDEIVPVAEPTDATSVQREDGAVVLAHGEVTGHKHQIRSRHAKLLRDESDARYLRVTAPVALRHEEHAPVKITSDRRVALHSEYVPGALPRTVAD